MKKVLGSSSKWRRAIWAKLGWGDEHASADIDEKMIRLPNAEALTVALASAKALAILPHLTESCILVTGDQVVTAINGDGSELILEKPEDDDEALRQVFRMGTGTTVYTVSAIVAFNTATQRYAAGHDIASVTYRHMPPDLMKKLAMNPENRSCAGCLRLEDEDAAPYLKEVVGTADSIAGLPLDLVRWLVSEVE